jgi:hypothetical protein
LSGPSSRRLGSTQKKKKSRRLGTGLVASAWKEPMVCQNPKSKCREQRFFKILLVELHLMQHRQDRFFSYSGAKQAKAGPWRFKGFFFTFIQYT